MIRVKKVLIAKVAKNKLREERFINIWKRVIRVSEISPLISPELPKEPELIEITNIMDKISKIGSYEKEMAEQNIQNKIKK